jgi:CBS domain-containing protein
MKEYADFLGSQPPYDALTSEDLVRLVEALEVEYFAARTTIVEADQPPLDHMWVIRSGAVEILDRGRVVDHLGPGDTFGHISVLTGLPPAVSARALEDSLCIRLPDPRRVVRDAKQLRFSHVGTMLSPQRLTGSGTLDETPGSARSQMRPVVWAHRDEPVADVARRITDAGHSGALVRRGDEWGIVTDHDFRKAVATGEIAPSAPVEALATFPAIAVSEEFSQAAAFARMIDRGIHHLVVLDRQGTPEGILRAVDFASADIRRPLVVRSQIEAAGTIEALRVASELVRPTLVELGDTGVPGPQIGNLQAAIVDAILRKLVAFHGLAEGPSAPSLVVLGSMARREPLPTSDVDTAMVWSDEVSEADVAEHHERTEALLTDMESCGFAREPAVRAFQREVVGGHHPVARRP